MSKESVWTVVCSCGLKRTIRSEEVSKELFKAHSENRDDHRCGSASRVEKTTYDGLVVDVEATLPQNIHD